MFELCATFIDCHGMSDGFCRRASGKWESTALHPLLVSRHAIDGVEQPYKANLRHWTAERLPERFHVVVQFLFLHLVRVLVVVPSLPLGKCPPGKQNQILIPSLEQAKMVHHLGQKTHDICPATKPKHIDLVPRRVVAHEESVPAPDMFGEC